jgi:hypothetical protein
MEMEMDEEISDGGTRKSDVSNYNLVASWNPGQCDCIQYMYRQHTPLLGPRLFPPSLAFLFHLSNQLSLAEILDTCTSVHGVRSTKEREIPNHLLPEHPLQLLLCKQFLDSAQLLAQLRFSQDMSDVVYSELARIGRKSMGGDALCGMRVRRPFPPSLRDTHHV